MMDQTCAVNDPTAVRRAADIIQSGGVIVYPTETLYGIGANALDSRAAKRVREVKKRGDGKPILVIVSGVLMVPDLVREVSVEASILMTAFWPGPLTLVFRALATIPDEVTQGTGSVGIRVPSHEFCLSLVRECGFPVTSTSANISGKDPPRTVADLRKALKKGVDLFVDGGTLPSSLPSTVVDVTSFPPRLVRRGAIPAEALLHVLPQVIIPEP